MNAFGVVMLIITIILFLIGYILFKGKEERLFQNHRGNVVNTQGYSKAIGLAFGIIGLSALISSITAFSNVDEGIPGVVFILGFVLGIILIVRAQLKYNGRL